MEYQTYPYARCALCAPTISRRGCNLLRTCERWALGVNECFTPIIVALAVPVMSSSLVHAILPKAHQTLFGIHVIRGKQVVCDVLPVECKNK